MMITLLLADGLGVEPSATDTAAVLPGLNATTAILRPLASTVEEARATMMRVRMSFMASNPPGAPARMSREITLCNVDADKNILTGIKGDGQCSALPSPPVAARSYPSSRHLMSHEFYLVAVRIL